MPIQLISYLQDTGFDLYNMREWLSGGAPPCQGGGRGFDPRLALYRKDKTGVKAEKLWHRLLSLCLTAHVTNG